MAEEDQSLLPARGIKSWHKDERPREKLQANGAAQLTLAELLGILIGSGHQEATAIEIGREILSAVDYDLHALSRWQPQDYCRFKGIGPARAVTLAAAMELTRRRQEQNHREEVQIKGSEDGYNCLKAKLADLDHEECWLLCLSQSNRLLATHLISKGGITGTVVDARIVFRHAINTQRCVSVILAHNHPSGNLKPSHADIQLTHKLIRAGKQLDIKVHDHLIITQQGYFSFADEGLIET